MRNLIRSAIDKAETSAPAEKGIFETGPAFFCQLRGEDAVPGGQALSELEAKRIVIQALYGAGNRID